MATAPPLEDRGPLSGSYYLPAQDARDTHLPLRKVQRLGQNIRQLEGGSDVDQLHVAILDHFMREVFPNVDMLGPLPSANDVATHSMHAMLSSYTGVGVAWAKPMFSST